jgi:hypothetical protein
MRRSWATGLAALVVVLGGCKDAFRARPEVAAEAGGQELKVERLADLMVGIKGVPLSREAAEFIANMWVDQTLFAQAVAAGRDLADSATAAAVLWPELAEARGTRWHDSLIARRVPITDAVADSIYNADQVRLLQHILVRVQPNAEPPARAAARKKAEGVLARLRAGANFGKVASEVSEDQSRSDSGYLPPSPRGRWVTAFDSAGWTLAPGAMTGLVESPFGYHVIRRPPVAEVRDRMLSYARDRIGAVLDSIYLDSLAARKHLVVEGGAAQAMRGALADKDKASKSTKVLARYDGGALTVADFMRWVNGLGQAWATDLAGRPDSMLVDFARLIGQNQILLAQADSAGISVSSDEWASMRQRYRAQVDTLRMSFGLAESDFTDPATTPSDRVRAASVKIESFWDRIARGQGRPRPIPDQLAAVLRHGADYKVNQPGLLEAVRLAQEKRAHADSVAPPPPAAGQAPPGVGPGAPQPPAPAPPGKGGR